MHIYVGPTAWGSGIERGLAVKDGKGPRAQIHCRLVARKCCDFPFEAHYWLFGVTGSGGSAGCQGEVLRGTRTRLATRADAENELQRLRKYWNCSGVSQGRRSVATESQRSWLLWPRRGRVTQAKMQGASRMMIWLDERRSNLLCKREMVCQWRGQNSPGNFGGDPSTASPRLIRRLRPETSTCGHECPRFESGGAGVAATETLRGESARRLPQREARKERPGNQGSKVRAGAMSLIAKCQRCDISRPDERCARLLGSEPIPSRAYESLAEVQPVWLHEITNMTQANSVKTQLDTQAAAGCRPRVWPPVFVVPRMNESGGP